MSRTKSSLLNIFASYCGQLFGAIILLISRMFFIKILGEEYLGLNGLFANILTMLSLVELGFGQAIIFSLYKPIANNDKEQIKSIMKLYKKIYNIIGLLVLILGLSLTPFLNFFIKDIPNISNIKLIYCLFVINSSISYCMAYKRTLINSDTKRYILQIYKYLFCFILNTSQIIFLILTHNYFIYLILQILFTFLENYIVSKKADKMYPFLKEKNIKDLNINTKKEIVKNTKAMTSHKLGSIIVKSTDNIIISKYISLISVGIYSNYYLIINALESVTFHIFDSITASIGNLFASKDKNKVIEMFNVSFFVNYSIISIFTTILFNVLNQFISIWIGYNQLFTSSIVAVIILNFYLNGMRKSELVFRDAMGLYYQDRYKPLFESLINLVFSIILAKKYGIIGVLIGTTISTLTTCFWIEPYVLFKYGLKEKVSKYFIKYIKYLLLTIFSLFISYLLCNLIVSSNIVSLIIKMIICLIISLINIIIFNYKTEEYKYIIYLLKNIKKVVKKS